MEFTRTIVPISRARFGFAVFACFVILVFGDDKKVLRALYKKQYLVAVLLALLLLLLSFLTHHSTDSIALFCLGAYLVHFVGFLHDADCAGDHLEGRIVVFRFSYFTEYFAIWKPQHYLPTSKKYDFRTIWRIWFGSSFIPPTAELSPICG